MSATMKTGSRRTCLTLALAFALSSPAWAKQLDPGRSVIGDNENIVVSIRCPTPTTGDLYIAANAGGVLNFYHDDGSWRPDFPAPHEYAQTCSGTKQIILGNTRDIGPGTYPLYQVFTHPNTADVYDTRNWVGGMNGLGSTCFQIKLPKQISGDHNGDGWADDDWDHDGYHDDDSDHDGYHDDDSDHDGYHDDDSDHDGFHDDDLHHVGFHADECKNGGWMRLRRANHTGFRNQGDCIQYVNTGK